MKINLTRSFVICICLASSCLAFAKDKPVSEWSVDEVAQATKSVRDDFKKQTTVSGVLVLFKEIYPVDEYRFQFRAFAVGNDPITYDLAFDTQVNTRKDWLFWKTAADQDGKEFKLDELYRGVETRIHEVVSADLTREYLEKIKEKGTKWRVYGTAGYVEVSIPANVVEGFIKGSDALLAKK